MPATKPRTAQLPLYIVKSGQVIVGVALLGTTLAHGNNLVLNGDFDASNGNWQQAGACQVFYDDVVGSPARSSLGMNCLGAGAVFEVASQCVNLSAPATIDFSARWSRNTSLPPGQHGDDRFGSICAAAMHRFATRDS